MGVMGGQKWKDGKEDKRVEQWGADARLRNGRIRDGINYPKEQNLVWCGSEKLYQWQVGTPPSVHLTT